MVPINWRIRARLIRPQVHVARSVAFIEPEREDATFDGLRLEHIFNKEGPSGFGDGDELSRQANNAINARLYDY